MTMQEVKAILKISDDKHDDYISAMLPRVESFVKQYCKRTDIPDGLEVAVAKIIQYELQDPSLQSRTIGDLSWSHKPNYPDNIMKILNAYKRLVIV